MMFPDHKVALQLKKRPNLAKNVNNNPKNFTFCWGGGLNNCYIDNQQLCPIYGPESLIEREVVISCWGSRISSNARSGAR